VGLVFGAAALVGLIHGYGVWPLEPFVATIAYLAVAALELTLAHGGEPPER